MFENVRYEHKDAHNFNDNKIKFLDFPDPQRLEKKDRLRLQPDISQNDEDISKEEKEKIKNSTENQISKSVEKTIFEEMQKAKEAEQNLSIDV